MAVGHITRSRTTMLAIWGCSIVLALLFISSALPKLSGAVLTDFLRWNYAPWFMLVVGTMELTSAALIIIPRTAFWGAVGMIVVLVGALGTIAMHLRVDAARLPLTMAALLLALVVAWARGGWMFVARHSA